METVTPRNRLIGAMPKVGIRPVIDGRRKGVRESLENQTMAMAQQAALLISSKLRHSNGLPVECVIADTCIGGLAESAMAVEKFRRENVGLTLTVTPCWCYGAETIDMDPMTIKAIWGKNGTERPGAVYLASAGAAHAQKGLPVFKIYGQKVQTAEDSSIPEDVQGMILRFVKAGLAVATMRGKTYLSIGGTSMGIAGSIVNTDFFEDYLGMAVLATDMSEVSRRLGDKIFDEKEFDEAHPWTIKNCPEGEDRNALDSQRSRFDKNEDWRVCVRMAIIVRDLMVGNPRLAELGFGEEALGANAILAGFQGQRQWTDFMPNGDFLEAILNSSFDWTGIREPFIVATENDSLNGVCMLLGHLLENLPQVFADVRTFWSPEAIEEVTGIKKVDLPSALSGGMIHLINSGAATLDACGQMRDGDRAVMKPWWDVTAKDVEECLAATVWSPANTGYFRGGGFSSTFGTRAEMPVTMSRLNIIKGLGPVLQIAEGHFVDVPPEVYKPLEDRTDPTWPSHWFVPRTSGHEGPFKDAYSVMATWGANHGVLSYGHIGADLVTIASMLRIPVCMHNVASQPFRPAVWDAFGTTCSESADRAACQILGPLYGKCRA